MSHWNYRVFQTQYQIKFIREKEPHLEDVFTIHEVYYDDDDKITLISADSRGISPSGDTSAGLRGDIQKMLRAVTKPILTPKDIPGYVYEKDEIPYGDTPNGV